MSVLTSHFSDRVFFPQKSRRAQPKGRWLPSRRSRCCFSVWSRAKYARDFRKRTRTFRWATRDCTCVKSGRQHATTVKLQRGDFFKLLLLFFNFLAFCKDFTNHVVHVLKKYKDHQWTVYKMFKLWRFFISFKCMLVVNMTLPKRVGKEAAKDCKIGVLKFKW